MLEAIQRLGGSDPQRGLYLCEDFVRKPAFIPYTEFPARVAACAEHFRAAGVRPGERILFPFETSEEIIFAFLGLMELGALPFSIKPYILSTPKQAYREFLGRLSERYRVECILDVPGLQELELPQRRVPLPPAGARAEGEVRLRTPAPEELAFVQFSSGSTSFPKGVPISHRNLLTNLRMIIQQDGRTPDERVMSWLPLYHDMGLIGGLLTCIVAGHDLYLSQPVAFLMDPLGWLEFLSERRLTGSVVPNFAIDYLLKHLRGLEREDYARLDLSAMRGMYLGSEPINILNLEAFTELLAPNGIQRNFFKPCYGMAEAVLMVSCVDITKPTLLQVVTAPNGQQAISVGTLLPGFEVRLRAEDGRLCGENEFGEIELRGGSLVESYFEDDRPLRGPDGFYATGDLGFMREGELFITGRINDRIKVNGQSFFSNDFEQAVERLPFIRPGRTTVIQVNGRIVVLAEVNHPAVLVERVRSQRRVCESVLENVGVSLAPEDVLFIRYGQLQKTSSGKLQRRAMALAYEQGRIRVATPAGLRADLLKMRAQRLFYLSLFALQQPRRFLEDTGRRVLEAGRKRLRRARGSGMEPGVGPSP